MSRARDWRTLIMSEDLNLESVYAEAVATIATEAASEQIQELDVEVPEAIELYRKVVEGDKPEWWPTNLPRLAIRVRVIPEDQNPHVYDDQEVFVTGESLGTKKFIAVLNRIFKSVGTPFHGRIEIKVLNRRTGGWVSGWSGNVEVSTQKRKAEDEKASGEDGIPDAMKWMITHVDNVYKSQTHLVAQASHVITASAHALNAMRGANAPPPWMQDGEGGVDDMPAWMRFGLEALGIASKTSDEGGTTVDAARQIASANYPGDRRRGPRAPAGLQIAGPVDMQGPPGSNYQWDHPAQHDRVDDFGPSGDYDGVLANQADILDDGFGDAHQQDDYYGEDDFEEEFEEEEDGGPFSGGGSAFGGGGSSSGSGNPLDGLRPEEVAKYFSQYIDENPQHKGAIKKHGMPIVKKLM